MLNCIKIQNSGHLNAAFRLDETLFFNGQLRRWPLQVSWDCWGWFSLVGCILWEFRREAKNFIKAPPSICVINTSFLLPGAFQTETSAEYLFSQHSLSSYIVSQSKDSQCLEECFCSERLFLTQSQGNSASLGSLRCLLVTYCCLLLNLSSHFQWKFITLS